MPLQSYDYTPSQAHSSPQRLGSIGHSQNLPFLDQSCYYENDDASSQSTASTTYAWKHESGSANSMSQLESTFGDRQQHLLQSIKSYSLHILVATIVALFLFEITVRLPFLLALTFAIPYVHMMLTPEKSTLCSTAYESDAEEGLYRRSSTFSIVPSQPAAQPKAPATIGPISITFPGLNLFLPSTWFPSATDPSRSRRVRLHTTYRESAYQPRRTFREALGDTGPRLLKRWGAFALETLCFQITSRVMMRIAQAAYEAMSGEEVNDNFVHMYVMYVLRFYKDWTVGLSSITWFVIKRIVGKTVLSLGKQTVMAAGGVKDITLEYEDANTVQF
ncbi:uncharacterized protein J4E87_004274 [Alternaria ethzedia]|uniref:uncharacterized protein n=1 Tax=Alternaria ethzedia TaxID=181014 RepID=UPI0020C3E0A5|nr:uncharacterized protein J4E87_004274 [Alternaria ethzedia]KAI4626933.1 hypothetical protein J4E87_004274 [Alternaria ethzedia]